MNRQNPYTQAAITRAIKAALASGLAVTAVRPDGTVLTEMQEKRLSTAPPPLTLPQKPRDAREKLGVH
jgi:hypothetical protein